MPSGRTHDRITLWSLPVLAGLTFGQTRNSNLTLLVSGGFLFSGLMFGPDLDIRSRQFLRWGYLRWIWLPYQTTLRHRSLFSHGPIIGTIVRIVYLSTWIGTLSMLVLIIMQNLGQITWGWPEISQMIVQSIGLYHKEWFALLIGLELGAMSHSLSDWGGSTYKRVLRNGWQSLLPKKKKKPKRRKKIVMKNRNKNN